MEVLQINNNSVDFKDQNPIADAYYTDDVERDSVAVVALVTRLQHELREAKGTHLACGEVLLPCQLLSRISKAIMEEADAEPCGLRGCTLYVSFENDQECRRLCTIKCDQSTTSTFELFLTLKQSTGGAWNSFLPQFIKKMTKSGSVVISSSYELTKKKLYRSFSE